MLVSCSALARELGVTPAAVTKAKTSRIAGAVVISGGKELLNREKALELWGKNTRPRGRGKTADVQAAVAAAPVEAPTPKELQAYIAELPEDEIPDIADSIKRKEHYNAEIARIKALKERNEAVDLAEVKREASTLGRTIRDNVIGVVARVAPTLAATMDVREVSRILESELRVALRVISV